jgi:hypothetical protein
MVTREQLEHLSYGSILHAGTCRLHKGPRGGVTMFIERWRVSGSFRNFPRLGKWFLPVKYGLKQSMHIGKETAELFHLESECPILKEEGRV